MLLRHWLQHAHNHVSLNASDSESVPSGCRHLCMCLHITGYLFDILIA